MTYSNKKLSILQTTKHFFKFSTLFILAANFFFLFQLNERIILNTYIYHNYLLYVSVFVTPSSKRTLPYFLKNLQFCCMCCAIKYKDS